MFQKGDPPKLISLEDVERKAILHGQSQVVSFCGSATFGVGVEGMLDLYHDARRITSVYWNGHWNRVRNELHTVNVDDEHYRVTMSIPSDEGILGDLEIDVGEVDANHSM